MNKIRKMFFRFGKRGQSATEYILILAVMVAIIVVVAKYMPGKFRAIIDKAMGKVESGIESTGTTE